MRRVWVGVLALAMVAGAAGCGSGDTTTVVKEPPTVTVEETVEVPAQKPAPKPVAEKSSKPAPAPEPAPEPEPKEAPNVVGLPLDIAEEMLQESGYRAAPENTDTTFGIVLPSNYTVCTQEAPRGTVVVMLAQKYGC